MDQDLQSMTAMPKLLTASLVLAWAVSNGFAAISGSFEANLGQVEPENRFLWRQDGAVFALASDHATLVPQGKAYTGALRIQFVRGRTNAVLHGDGAPIGRVNYILGNDARRWIRNAPTYRSVRARRVWPGVDVAYRSRGTSLEYDLIIKPGVDVRNLRVRFEGSGRVRLADDGDLLIQTTMGEIRHRRPVSYQMDGKRRAFVPTSFVLVGNTVGFRLGPYDVHRPLIIDPVISYSTRVGVVLDQVAAMAVDAQGNAYLTGEASLLPTTPLPPTLIGAGATLAFVTKISSDGQTALYRTYIGGGTGQGLAIAVDNQGNSYVCGVSGSSFPVTAGAFQTTPASSFVLKLDATGTHLVYSTYLGGKLATTCQAIAIDASGNAFVAGSTTSPDFPTTPGAFQPQFTGITQPPLQLAQHAFVSELNATGSALVYSTFLESSGNEGANRIALDAAGNAYVLGITTSTDFPSTPGVLRSSGGGSAVTNTGFLTKLNRTGSGLLYSTLVPAGKTFDGLAVDLSGNAYLAGTDNCPLGPLRDECDVLVIKVNAMATGLVYSTTFGGSLADDATAIAVDAQGNAYVAGRTRSVNFPATRDSVQTCGMAGNPSLDAFLARLDPNGSLASATYLGGSLVDDPAAIALDASGAVYMTGNTTSTDGPFAPTLGPGSAPVFLAKITFQQTNPPPVMVTCLGHAAQMMGGPVAPGEIVSIFGAGLGPSDPAFGQVTGGVLANSVGGTQVIFDGVPAPLLYVQDRQINAIVPYEIANKSTVALQVIRQGGSGQPVILPVTPRNPAIFSLSGTGIGQGAVLNEDGTLNSRSNPAKRGSIVSLYGTGLGQTDPASADGTITVPPLLASPPPIVLFGFLTLNRDGTTSTPQGEVLYAGPAPFLLSGVFQINVRVPQGAASGDVPLQFIYQSYSTFNAHATIAIE